MKGIVLIFITFSLVTAHVTRDSSKIIPDSKIASQPTISDVTRIVGGNEAVPNSIPYQVFLRLLYTTTMSSCGGSLITTRYVLTAAHCLVHELISLVVILGAHNVTVTESTQQRIPTTTFTIHEQYVNTSTQYDVGIVFLPTAATLNEYVQLVSLPSRADVSNSYAGSVAVASGWGFNSNSATAVSEVLRYVDVTILSNDVCAESYFAKIVNSTVCTSGAGGKGGCYGDSGGPLVVNGTLVGVFSFIGPNGCEGGDPTAYSRVTSFLDWIAANSDAVIS